MTELRWLHREELGFVPLDVPAWYVVVHRLTAPNHAMFVQVMKYARQPYTRSIVPYNPAQYLQIPVLVAELVLSQVVAALDAEPLSVDTRRSQRWQKRELMAIIPLDLDGWTLRLYRITWLDGSQCSVVTKYAVNPETGRDTAYMPSQYLQVPLTISSAVWTQVVATVSAARPAPVQGFLL